MVTSLQCVMSYSDIIYCVTALVRIMHLIPEFLFQRQKPVRPWPDRPEWVLRPCRAFLSSIYAIPLRHLLDLALARLNWAHCPDYLDVIVLVHLQNL